MALLSSNEYSDLLVLPQQDIVTRNEQCHTKLPVLNITTIGSRTRNPACLPHLSLYATIYPPLPLLLRNNSTNQESKGDLPE